MPNRPRPRVHARDHEHGGADPTLIHWEDVGDGGDGGGDGGGRTAAELKIEVSDDWTMECPHGTTNMRWKLAETPAANFDDYWQLYDFSADPTDAYSEFVNIGLKKWGTLVFSGFISCPSGHSSSDYKRVVDGQFGSWAAVALEEYDHRVDNVCFSASSAPRRSGWADDDVFYALKIQFSQASGATMYLAYAACNLLFVEADRT
jgi:hypothetical protein